MDAIQKAGGDSSQLKAVDGVMLRWCVSERERGVCGVCGEWCRGRGRGVAKERKKRVLSLSPWGCCVQCNLMRFGKGQAQKFPKCGEVSLGRIRGGKTLPYSRKLPRQASGRVCR